MKKVLIILVFCLSGLFQSSAEAANKYDDVINTLKTTRMGKVDFQDEPLYTIIEYLSDITGVNFVPTDSVQEEDFVIRKLTLKDGKTAYDFMRILSKLKEIDFWFKDGVVMVISKDGKGFMEPELRVYNINTLQFQTQDFSGPEIKLSSGDEGGFGSTDVEYGDDEDEPLSADEIAELIQAFTGGSTWDEVEGVSIEVKGAMLLVRQLSTVHDEIAALLQKLQESN